MLRIRTMREGDLPDVMRIQKDAYHAVAPESFEVMDSKRRGGEEFCFVCLQGGRVEGYLLAHPWESASVPHLNSKLCELPAVCDSIYLHDLAVSAALRGKSAGRLLAEALDCAVRRSVYRKSHLTAIQAAERFWEKMGYAIDHAHESDLTSYGRAFLMRKEFL